MPPTDVHVAYRAGRCARCGARVEGMPSVREVLLQVIGPAGAVAIHCWLDRPCQPGPEDVPAVARDLAGQLVAWYRSNPNAWPTLTLVGHA